MRVWVLCDDKWHPGNTVKQGLSPLESRDFEFEFIQNADEWSEEKMKAFPVVILSKSNNISGSCDSPWMTPRAEEAFEKYVTLGGGLLAIHSGTAEYLENQRFENLLGGLFTHHPDACDVKVVPRNGHPIVRGAEAFTVFDEHYFMRFDDSSSEVFMETISMYGTQPGGWAKFHGKGRVCVLTPGHTLSVWIHPQYQKMISNAIKWCGGMI